MKTNYRLCLVNAGAMAACLCSIGLISVAAPSDKPAGERGKFEKFGPWQDEAWTSNNAPYHNVRVSIDKQVAQGVSPDALAAKFAPLWRQDKRNLLALFRWGYAARKARLVPGPFNINKIIASDHAMEEAYRVQRAHAYDFSRLRFLNGAELFDYPKQQQLKGLGRRLMERKPKDDGVKYQLVRLLSSSEDVAERHEAIGLAQAMVREHPGMPKMVALQAHTYDYLWSLTRSHSDANQAIAAHLQYLQLNPQPPKELRELANRRIRVITQVQAAWEKQGKGKP